MCKNPAQDDSKITKFSTLVTIWPWLLAQAIVQLTLTDTKTRFRCIWFIQKVYWMVYKNGGDGGGDGGDAPLLVWWVWCYLVYWFPDLNLVKNSVGTLKPVQSKQTHSFGRVALCPSLDKAQELLWMVHTTPNMPVLLGSSGCGAVSIIFCHVLLSYILLLTPWDLVSEWSKFWRKAGKKQWPDSMQWWETVSQSIIFDIVSIYANAKLDRLLW